MPSEGSGQERRRSLGQDVCTRGVYLRRPSATRCKGAKSIRFPARHAQASTTITWACRGLNWTTSTSLMISLRTSLDRHRLLRIEPAVDPISPMLHQLSCASRKARAVRRQCRISVARRGSRRRSDLLWVGARAIVLARHLLDSVVRNSEIRRDRLISRCQQKYQQIGRMELTFYQCFQRSSKISKKYGIKPMP